MMQFRDCLAISGRTTGREVVRALRAALLGIAAIACLSLGEQSDARATVFAAVTDGSFFGVATFNDSLGFVSQVALPGPISGIAAGTDGLFYTASGNTIREYDASNTLLHSVSGSATTQTPALDFLDGILFASVTDGSFFGVARFNDSLGFVSQVALPGPISGLAAGTTGSFYTASGNTIREYDASNTLLHSVSGSATTLTPALDFLDGILFAAVTDGSFFGVARFNNSLGLVSQVALPGPISGIAAGTGGSFYTAAGNTIRHYGADNTLLDTISGSATTQTPALAFLAPRLIPEPSPLLLIALGFFLLGAGKSRAWRS